MEYCTANNLATESFLGQNKKKNKLKGKKVRSVHRIGIAA